MMGVGYKGKKAMANFDPEVTQVTEPCRMSP